jgi:RND superfamily putative drug exporter
MNRLSAFVRRRRKLVAIGWLVLLLASIPFASRQTENLTGGGFEAPGSGSAEVDHAVKRFQGASSESLGVLLQRKGGDAGALAAAVADLLLAPEHAAALGEAGRERVSGWLDRGAAVDAVVAVYEAVRRR